MKECRERSSVGCEAGCGRGIIKGGLKTQGVEEIYGKKVPIISQRQ